LDWFNFIKRPASATTRQNPVDPAGRTMTQQVIRARPGVFFLKCGFSPISFFSSFFSWLLTPFKVHYINTRKYFIFSM
jgi:hypothetical protein